MIEQKKPAGWKIRAMGAAIFIPGMMLSSGRNGVHGVGTLLMMLGVPLLVAPLLVQSAVQRYQDRDSRRTALRDMTVGPGGLRSRTGLLSSFFLLVFVLAVWWVLDAS